MPGWRFALKLLASALLLAVLLYYLDLESIYQNLRQAEFKWVFAALACLLLGQVLSAVRWAWLAEGLGLSIRIGRKIQLYFLGMFLSLFLPSILGGDVARGYLLAKGRKGQGWAAAASVLLERISGVAALSLLVTGCMFFLKIPGTWWTVWLTGLSIFWAGMLGYRFWQPHLPAFLSRLKQLPLLSASFLLAWRRSIVLSIVFQIMIVQAHVFLGQATGLELSWTAYGVIVCLVALATALPISFNGFGIREGGYVGMAIYFGGDAAAAAAMAVLWVLVLVLAALPGGVVLWNLGGTRAITNMRTSR
ncbi:MAG: lysylphosphatidylglycerol synthase transmembrane domain-containing protein [Mariprofundaceae bacterium]